MGEKDENEMETAEKVISKKMTKENIEKWQERGLFIYPLPPYSPSLKLLVVYLGL